MAIVVAVRALDITSTEERCSRPFDGERWRDRSASDDDRQAIARGLVRCRTLRGKTKREVRALLGPPSDRRGAHGGKWSYGLGMVNDYLGPGDGARLAVHFRDGRVHRAAAEPPLD